MLTAVSGVCVIHIPSGHYYIISGWNIRSATLSHTQQLKDRLHRNKKLQSYYQEEDAITLDRILCDTPEEALALETKLIDECWGDPYLCNTHRIGGESLTKLAIDEAEEDHDEEDDIFGEVKPKGVARKPFGAKGNQVRIEDKLYVSFAQASLALNVTATTVKNRCKSTKLKWANWIWIPKVKA